MKKLGMFLGDSPRPLFLALALALAGGAEARAAGGTIDDAQIAKVLLTINEAEVDSAKIALKESKNNEVKDFARAMEKEHEQNAKATKEWAKRADVSPANGPMSEAIAKDAKEAEYNLKAAKIGVDKAYVSQQVMMHEKALSRLDRDLIPGATNKDLKAHLEKTRAAVAKHLEHARTLQAKM